MKVKIFHIIVATLTILFFQNCTKSTEIRGLSISVDELVADQNGNPVDTDKKALSLIVSSEEKWEVTSSASWLSTNTPMGGISRTIVGVKVQPNVLGKERTASLTFTSSSGQEVVTVKQLGGEGIDPNTIVYELPVIFHVLYNEADRINTDTLRRKYVLNSSDAQRVLEYVNQRYGEQPPQQGTQIYRGILRRYQPTNDVYYMPKLTNIKFVLATKDPNGKQISPAGINSIAMDERSLEPSDVMQDKSGGRFHSMSWPIKDYINVFVFPFTKHGETEAQVTLGISHMPYALSSAPIEGLNTLPSSVEEQIKKHAGLDRFSNYNHCVVINSDAFEWRTWRYTFLKADLGKNTIAHELGHYLGLFHTFSEDHNEHGATVLNSCEDTDYCEDTPSYNRQKYEDNRREIIASGNTTFLQITGLLQRNDCSNGRFEATNIMDYDYSHSDEFSLQQINRMRQVLYKSYTTPGMKMVEPRSTIYSSPLIVVGNPKTIECKASY